MYTHECFIDSSWPGTVNRSACPAPYSPVLVDRGVITQWGILNFYPPSPPTIYPRPVNVRKEGALELVGVGGLGFKRGLSEREKEARRAGRGSGWPLEVGGGLQSGAAYRGTW